MGKAKAIYWKSPSFWSEALGMISEAKNKTPAPLGKGKSCIEYRNERSPRGPRFTTCFTLGRPPWTEKVLFLFLHLIQADQKVGQEKAEPTKTHGSTATPYPEIVWKGRNENKLTLLSGGSLAFTMAGHSQLLALVLETSSQAWEDGETSYSRYRESLKGGSKNDCACPGLRDWKTPTGSATRSNVEGIWISLA